MTYQELQPATIRKNTFNTVFTLLDANKLSGWTIYSAFPERNPSFPCIVINPAIVSVDVKSLERSVTRRKIQVKLEYYAYAQDGKEAIDEGRDNDQDVILTSFTTLKTYKMALDTRVPFIDSTVEGVEINGNKFNTAETLVNFVRT